MTPSKTLKWITGGLELFLAIPVLGGLIVVNSAYTVLFFMLIFHIVTLVLSVTNREPFYGSILGIVTSVVGWIPIVGWLMHLLSGIFLMITAAQPPRDQYHRRNYYDHYRY
ncbi:hypothetical protein [Paenibacillus brasilensis]|uniref:Membrane protein YqhA n=1 Tax=Paenibacillus brasilensis TaxID=128574 RepID=A0ABU0L0Q2_9BACL|nr:hypothetical protein [Paenibacillus brasilensis]MDQ0493812.1 putative membrane protein YqhA [Paenibacillus brasilensis]